MLPDEAAEGELKKLAVFAKCTEYEIDTAERQRRDDLLEAETLAVDYARDEQSAALMQAVRDVVIRIYRSNPDTGIEYNFGPDVSAEQLVKIHRRHRDTEIDQAPARLNPDEKDKLDSIVGKLEAFLKLCDLGRNDFVMDRVVRALKELRTAQSRAALAADPRWLIPLPKIREALVMMVASAWHRFTGEPCTASWNAQVSGVLNRTPLVRFVWAVLGSALPQLSEGEVLRGIKFAGEDRSDR